MHPLIDFTPGERKAIITLLALLLVISLYSFFRQEKESAIYVDHSPIELENRRKPLATPSVDTTYHPTEEETKTASSPSASQTKSNKKTPRPPITPLSLNQADSLQLEKLPGLGPVLSARIVKYRNLLGGFYQIEQLREVYGIDEARYQQIKPYLTVKLDSLQTLSINEADYKALLRHPYLSSQQVKRIFALRKQQKSITSWTELIKYEEFPDSLVERLKPYIRF